VVEEPTGSQVGPALDRESERAMVIGGRVSAGNEVTMSTFSVAALKGPVLWPTCPRYWVVSSS
jgi:hypothetical protein